MSTIPITDVTEGDLLDLEGDPYADPNGDGTCNCEPDCDHWYSWEFELAKVVNVDEEGPDTIVLGFEDQGVIAFPRTHQVKREARMRCRHCSEPIREAHDPNVPFVHEGSGNGYCDVTTPASAVFLSAFNPTEMRTEAEPEETVNERS